jgi:hypothetical protein
VFVNTSVWYSVPAAAPCGPRLTCRDDESHVGAAATGADDGVVSCEGVTVGLGLELSGVVAEVEGVGEMLLGDATGSFDPPEQPASAARVSRAQMGPKVRTTRA